MLFFESIRFPTLLLVMEWLWYFLCYSINLSISIVLPKVKVSLSLNYYRKNWQLNILTFTCHYYKWNNIETGPFIKIFHNNEVVLCLQYALSTGKKIVVGGRAKKFDTQWCMIPQRALVNTQICSISVVLKSYGVVIRKNKV